MWQNVVSHRLSVADTMRQSRNTDDLGTLLFAAVTAPLLKTHLAFAEYHAQLPP